MTTPNTDLRQWIADEVSGFPIGSGYYGTTIAAGSEAYELADLIMPLVAEAVKRGQAEALRAWARGVESRLDATTSEGIVLGEWELGLRSGAKQARDTADQIEKEAAGEH